MTRPLLASVALLVALTSAAAAQDNLLLLDQNGDDNTALVRQDGGANTVGAARLPHEQEGDRNALSVTQSGSGNEIGTGSALLLRGIQQVNQRAGSAASNTATFTQTSDDNTVGIVAQRTGFGGANLSGNALVVLQGVGDGNRIDRIVQERGIGADAGNSAAVTQLGTANVLTSVGQVALGDGGNSLTATFRGNRHGRLPALGTGPAASMFRGFSGVGLARVNRLDQVGSGNVLSLSVDGLENLVGTLQLGIDNVADAVAIDGIRNSVGVDQDGVENTLTLLSINGNGNNVGVSQIGASNEASVTVTGSSNGFFVSQVGPLGGSGNTATIEVRGNENGAGLSVIRTAADTRTALDSYAGLFRGGVFQVGEDNLLDLSVEGNRNVFAVAQDGSGNRIDGTQDGGGNMAAVVQVGAMNTSVFSQVGSNNALGITQ